jgi:hypothetical protein
MGLKTNDDGSLREFTAEEVEALGIESRGVRDGSHPTHVRAVNSNTVQVKWLCDFDMFEDAVAYWLGGAVRYVNFSGDYKVSRVSPQSPPGLPNFAYTKIESATGHQFLEDDEDGNPTYSKMDVTLTAEHVPFDLLPDEDTSNETFRYFQVLPSQPSADYLTLPGGVCHYLTEAGGAGRPNQVAIPYNVGLTQPKSIIRRKWWRVPYDVYKPGHTLYKRIWGDPANDERPWVGTVNANALFNYPRWTLLFLGVEEELDRDQLGDRLSWNLTYSWQYDPNCHLKKYYYDMDSGANNGYYFVAGRGGTTWVDQNGIVAIDDDYTLFPERDQVFLFSPADVP